MGLVEGIIDNTSLLLPNLPEVHTTVSFLLFSFFYGKDQTHSKQKSRSTITAATALAKKKSAEKSIIKNQIGAI